MEPWGQQGWLGDGGCKSFSCNHLLVLGSSLAANPPVACCEQARVESLMSRVKAPMFFLCGLEKPL